MNHKALIKIAVLGVVLALALSLLSLLFLNRATSTQTAGFRNNFLSFYATSIERQIRDMSLAEVRQATQLLKEDRNFRGPPPPPPFGGPPPRDDMMGPPPPRPPFEERKGSVPPPFAYGDKEERRPPPPMGGRGPDIWLVSEQGEVLHSRENSEWDLLWADLPRPSQYGEILSKEDFFRLSPTISVIKLNTVTPLYIVTRDKSRDFLAPLLMTQAVLTASMIFVALLVSLAALFFYLRRKSSEARSVLRRLEQGDLKARFEIQRFDEFGELMLDFNRMAEEIEKLVGRIHATESKRKTLLQEISHDLRTPLTSLKANFETLQNHYDRISPQDRNSLFNVLVSEIDYFKELIEKLMTIASLDEPHFKASTEVIELTPLLQQELKTRQDSVDNKISWELQN
ncbi:MAG: histidine kinase dimerization/phospho-acceptor domain-containing protein, partial [Bdellovibrio sp.]